MSVADHTAFETSAAVVALAPVESLEADRFEVSAEAQWEHLVGAHADSLWRFALNLGLTDSEAEAICELAWLRLAQRWSPIGGHSDEQVREWLEETVCWESRATPMPLPSRTRRPRLRLVPTPDSW